MTVYIDGGPLSKAHLEYYSITEEVAALLERMMDPVDFMCQVPMLLIEILLWLFQKSDMLTSCQIKPCNLDFTQQQI